MQKFFLIVFILCTMVWNAGNIQCAVLNVIEEKAGNVLAQSLDEGNIKKGELYFGWRGADNAPVLRCTGIKLPHAVLITVQGMPQPGELLLDQDWFAVMKLMQSGGDMETALSHIKKYDPGSVFSSLHNADFEDFKEIIHTLLKSRLSQVEGLVSQKKITSAHSSLFLLCGSLGDYYFSLESEFSDALSWYMKGMRASPRPDTLFFITMLERAGDCQVNLGQKNEAAEFYSKALQILHTLPGKRDERGIAFRLNKKKTSLAQAANARGDTPKRDSADSLRAALVKTAQSLIGKKWTSGLTIKNKRFNFDCSGTVARIFWENGIDLFAGPGKSGGGVQIIYHNLKLKSQIHNKTRPHPADLVFFDNTYDRNRDGKWNDRLVHIGIVERVDPDGTCTFIHHCSSGIQRYRMNLLTPRIYQDNSSGKILNSFIRKKKPGSDPPGSAYVSGAFFAGFATVASRVP